MRGKQELEALQKQYLDFQNDMRRLRTKDDVPTLLVHPGYLGCDAEKGETESVIQAFEGYTGEILLAGISYSRKT